MIPRTGKTVRGTMVSLKEEGRAKTMIPRTGKAVGENNGFLIKSCEKDDGFLYQEDCAGNRD